MLLLGLSLALGRAAPMAQGPLQLEITSQGDVVGDVTNGLFYATNDVVVRLLTSNPSSNVVLTAEKIAFNTNNGDLDAEGNVRVIQTNLTLTGPHLHYNYLTRQMDWGNFRAGETPFFTAGEALHAEGTNGVYSVTNALVTTDDYSRPLETVHAGRMTIVPGKYVAARNAVLYAGDVPVFYFPYYHHDLTQSPDHFTFLPGYRGIFGPYLLSTYEYTVNNQLSGAIHADYRELRGFGVGPDFTTHLGQFGDATFKYYYTHDDRPDLDQVTAITPIPHDRQRAYMAYQATPLTNLYLMSQAAYLSDPFVTHDFFESQYVKDIEPTTFFDADKLWSNWTLDAMAQPQLNGFYETVERLPDARLTGLLQQIPGTPLYYQSESSAGYYEHRFADTNQMQSEFAGGRADTFHQVTLPETFLGWLDVTPRVGGRFTYYSGTTGPGATTTNQDRWLLETGTEVSFKASQTWKGLQSDFWDLDGLRHIIQPSLDYEYVPRPNVQPQDLPQFDYEPTNTLELQPLEFPDYNAIDTIDAMNTMRFGLNNRLQTKRDGELVNWLNWDLDMDWRLRHDAGHTTFSDIYSDLQMRPRQWLALESFLRYDIATTRFNLAQNSITFQPNSTWNLSVGQFFLRDNTVFGTGNDLFNATFFYRLNENWGARIAESFDAKSGTLEEQDYTIYRDLRSWTAALTFRALDNQQNGHDYAVAVTFSFKAFPRFSLGQDTVNDSTLIGY
jgi:lipopolysaccharide assembly outer membrane protein LptD (OstA)